MKIKQVKIQLFIVFCFLLGIVVGMVLMYNAERKIHNAMPLVYYGQAQIDLENNNVDSALFYLRKSSCLDNKPLADFKLAKIFIDKKNYALAAYYLEIGISKEGISPIDKILASCDLYQTYKLLDKRDLAEKELMKIKQFGTNYVADVCYTFGKAAINQKKYIELGKLRLKTYLLFEARPEKTEQIIEIKDLLKNLRT